MRTWLCGFLVLSACTGSARSRVEAADAASPANDAATSVGDASKAEAGTAMGACFDPMVVGTVAAGTPDIQSCAIWNSLGNMTGSVTLTRTGAMLTMAFQGGVAFSGAVTGASVTLTHYALHDFTDGCTWRATETLSGTLDPTLCKLSLGYAYVETVETSDGACDSPCSGSNSFSLEVSPVIN